MLTNCRISGLIPSSSYPHVKMSLGKILESVGQASTLYESSAAIGVYLSCMSLWIQACAKYVRNKKTKLERRGSSLSS